MKKMNVEQKKEEPKPVKVIEEKPIVKAIEEVKSESIENKPIKEKVKKVKEAPQVAPI